VKATVIRAEGQADAAMEDGDALIFMNFRADRAREITRAFVNSDFDGFARKKVVNLDFIMLTEYAADIKAPRIPASLAGKHLRRVDGEERQNAAAYLRNGKICARDLLL
jgi:2,3-bisphosphoglycerate-independent phosphoglycerate mutase